MAVSVLITDSVSRFCSPSPLLQLRSPPYGPDAEAQLEPLEGPRTGDLQPTVE